MKELLLAASVLLLMSARADAFRGNGGKADNETGTAVPVTATLLAPAAEQLSKEDASTLQSIADLTKKRMNDRAARLQEEAAAAMKTANH